MPAIRDSIHSETAWEDQATALAPVSFTGLGKSPFLINAYREERPNEVWDWTCSRRINDAGVEGMLLI